MKATLVRHLEGYTGDARLYKLSDPVEWSEVWDEDGKSNKTEFVVVSATVAFDTGAETYIFPADDKGKILNWCELSGSFKGGMDHSAALENAGYQVE